MNVRFWGTRGSIATPGSRTTRYGGNTSCVAVTSDQGTLVILDCGTGARLLGDHLLQTCELPIHGSIFLTHTHWDHIQGFPFFGPAFVATNAFMIYGPTGGAHHLEQALAGQMQYTYFPVELERLGASLQCRDIGEGAFHLDDVQVCCQYLNHPALTLGYRLTIGDATVVYSTDHEPFSPVLFKQDTTGPTLDAIVHDGDRRHAEFLRGADLVIHDAQYTAHEYEAKRNWGHSPIDYVVGVACAASVKRLALFHHDPAHDDTMLDAIQGQARSLVTAQHVALDVFCARERDEIHLEEGAHARSWRTGHPSPHLEPESKRILIVDDDAAIREVVQNILEEEGYVLEFAGDGEEALARVAARVPDLMLLDLRIPKIDGWSVLERLRSSDATRDLPIIMLTAADDTTEQGFKAGATDYMTKPFSEAHLRARISSWLLRTAESASHVP
jgi:CheY-like chemotaxis protein/phosphoribosyl 1,2-cyclic phosphodiesterase